jgi:hypothetical protein
MSSMCDSSSTLRGGCESCHVLSFLHSPLFRLRGNVENRGVIFILAMTNLILNWVFIHSLSFVIHINLYSFLIKVICLRATSCLCFLVLGFIALLSALVHWFTLSRVVLLLVDFSSSVALP